MDLHNQTLTIGSDILDFVQIHHIASVPTKTYDTNGRHLRSREILSLPIKGWKLLHQHTTPSNKEVHLPRRLKIAIAYPACASEIQIHALDIPHLPFQPTLHYSVYSTDTYHERPPITPTISRLHDSVYSTNFYDEHLPVIPPISHPHDSVYSTKLHHECPPIPPPIPCALDYTTEFPETTTILHNAYVPPEADWESHLPFFPARLVDYDIANDIDLSRAALSNDQKNRLLDIIRFHANAFVGPDGHDVSSHQSHYESVTNEKEEEKH
ncbi:hypothetical protein Y032_0007g3358 [Ancylostoma ceylanicum]|nr:hypothetical protein Y032_0007g3358 [Ancylostoma ceylanicum]